MLNLGCRQQIYQFFLKMIEIPRLGVEVPAHKLILDDRFFAALRPMTLECLNWPEEFPYRPRVDVRICHNDSHLFLEYSVSEKCTRALETVNGCDVYKDSCVEFFVMPEGSDQYYNFEWNAIGTLCMSRRPGRQNATPAPDGVLNSVLSSSTCGCKPFSEISGDNHWVLRVAIPCSALFGDALKTWQGASLKGNFYKCGDGLSCPHYITMFPIQTPSPDYHRPEFFRDLLCE